MSKKPEDKIEEKLRQLEISMKEDSASNVPAALDKSSSLSKAGNGNKAGSGVNQVRDGSVSSNLDSEGSLKADLHMLGGFTGIGVGLLVLLGHLRVWSGYSLSIWGPMGTGGGQGLTVLLLLVGIGIFIYDYKNKISWMLIVGSLVAIILGIFTHLQIAFPAMSLLDYIFMFLPLLLGSALLAKGLKLQKESKDASGS